jgi:sulfate/thiosulfate transport system ATP-binding protein
VALEAHAGDFVAAKVESLVARGPFVRVELTTDRDARTIEADLSRERLRALELTKGQAVFIRPTSLHVFDEDQAAE